MMQGSLKIAKAVSLKTFTMAVQVKESQITWTVGPHSIDCVFPPIFPNWFTVKYKPVGDHREVEKCVKAENDRITLYNLRNETTYDIRVYYENDAGFEKLCLKTQLKTDKSAISSLLNNARQDNDTSYLYHLKPVRQPCDDNNSVEYLCFEYNPSQEKLVSKTILLTCGVSTGKTTLVNAIANHFLGVEYADNVRLSTTEETDTMKENGKNIVSFQLAPLETSRYKWNLKIVDVRGFRPSSSDTENRRTVECLEEFLRKNHVDFFCLVVKSSSRLTTEEWDILVAAKEAIELQLGVKYVPLVTFYSGGTSSALEVLKGADVPYHGDLCFYFNNGTINNPNLENVDTWNDRKSSLRGLLSQLDDRKDYRGKPFTNKPRPTKKFSTEATSNSISIEFSVANKQYKIQYRTKSDKRWQVIEPQVTKVNLDGLKGDTLYEIRVFEVEEDGKDVPIGATEVKTRTSKGVQHLANASQDAENSRIHHLKATIQNFPETEVKTVPIDGLPTTAEEKTILLFGSQGSGKKAMVDAMINYIFQVEFGDEFRFSITKTGCNNKSEKNVITLYRIAPPSTSELQYVLNIVLVPSVESKNPQYNKEIHSNFHKMLETGKVQNISFACIVAPSTCRLTDDERQIFENVTSVLGRDVSFLVPLITFYDGGSNTALKVLREAKVPCFDHLYFSFNNANLLCSKETFSSWNQRNKVLHHFFQEIRTTPNIAVENTRNVLASLGKIEAISHEEERIRLRLKEIKNEEKLIRKNNPVEDSNVSTKVLEKRKEATNNKCINCRICKTTCKTDFNRVWRWFWCFFMLIETIFFKPCCNWNILNCKCKCRLGEHVMEKFRYNFVEIPSVSKPPENKSDKRDVETKTLLKEYRRLYTQLKSEVKFLKTNALQYTDNSMVGQMETILNGRR